MEIAYYNYFTIHNQPIKHYYSYYADGEIEFHSRDPAANLLTLESVPKWVARAQALNFCTAP